MMMRRMSEGDMWKGLMPWVVMYVLVSEVPAASGGVVRSHVVLVLPLSAVRVNIKLTN